MPLAGCRHESRNLEAEVQALAKRLETLEKRLDLGKKQGADAAGKVACKSKISELRRQQAVHSEIAADIERRKRSAMFCFVSLYESDSDGFLLLRSLTSKAINGQSVYPEQAEQILEFACDGSELAEAAKSVLARALPGSGWQNLSGKAKLERARLILRRARPESKGFRDAEAAIEELADKIGWSFFGEGYDSTIKRELMEAQKMQRAILDLEQKVEN